MKQTAVLLVATLALAGCGRGLATAPRRPAAAAAAQALSPARFFADARTQASRPLAFVLPPAGQAALPALAAVAPAQREALVAAIRADKALAAKIAAFGTLDWPAQRAVLERVMDLESRANGAERPPLVVHEEQGDGPAFFEFDPARPGTGTVHLWPKNLAEEPGPYAALLLTVHETRHSWQFQQAYGAGKGTVLGRAFAAGFEAQNALKGKLTFCDFCTMQHEHEAFQTGNQVVGMLTGWQADTEGMGCWSSQFDGTGALRIDVAALAAKHGPAGVLAAFNAAERPQFEALGGAAAATW